MRIMLRYPDNTPYITEVLSVMLYDSLPIDEKLNQSRIAMYITTVEYEDELTFVVLPVCTANKLMDELLCNGCSTCANVCPYGAITYEVKQVNDHGIREERRIAVVNSALCQGCGACTVACPSGAMDLQGFSNRQIIAEVDAICR